MGSTHQESNLSPGSMSLGLLCLPLLAGRKHWPVRYKTVVKGDEVMVRKLLSFHSRSMMAR